MWFCFPIIGPIILLYLTKPCISVKGCTVILRNPKSLMKKAVCNMPNSNLKSIPSDLPDALVELDISFQQLTIIRNKAFIHLPNLESLSITSSNVHTIQEGAFIKLSKLKTLILTNNSLIISSDNPKSLSKYIFLPLLDLKTLDLSWNFIGKIPDFFFNHVNQTLDHLQLSHSKTEVVLLKNSLLYLGMLSSLQLYNSQMTSISSELEEALNLMVNLKELVLFGNLWHCDCQLKWFIVWMMKKLHFKAGFNSKWNQLICVTPPLMKNRDLLGDSMHLIEDKEFQCIPEPVTLNSTVSTYVGQNISLSCRFKNINNNDKDNYQILWKKDHHYISVDKVVNKRFIIVETKGKYRKSVLTILNVSKTEEGLWKCLVKHSEKSIEIDFLVNVESDYFPDMSMSTLKTSGETTKSATVYGLVFTCLIVIFIIVLLVILYYFKYHNGTALSIGGRSHFNVLAKNKSKKNFYKITKKSTSNHHSPMNPFSLSKDSVKLEEKIYDNVPISSGFYINFTKKKNEQNFSTLNCMDCQNYAIVDESLNINPTINVNTKSKSPRFWYLDDSIDGIDYLPSSFAIGKNLDLTDISEKDSAFITRIPSQTPCPVHSSQSSMSNFKRSISDFSQKTSNPISEIDSCPIHGKKNFQSSYSVHFSIADQQQLNKSSKHSQLSHQSPDNLENVHSGSFKKSAPHNYFPVYLSSVDMQLKDGSHSRPYSCLTNSVV